MSSITFISSNQEKVDNLSRLLQVQLVHKNVELMELQSVNMEEIIRHKAEQAYEVMHSPVLVDDATMWIDELHGLPGPFIKFFVKAKNGAENLCRMTDGLTSRRATAQAYFGLYDGVVMTIIHGEITGEIASHPRGNNGFSYGWDSVFCPDGYGGRTRAELTQHEYDEVYKIIRPIKELKVLLS
ncbi:MAG: non-canonical purine NTP pyrophosphatase [Candidatus Saccharimonadales bacterium]